MPREFLLFRLSGPLASWGEIAVGERRSSWPRPSKSAVLGLVAAAFGYDRRDGEAHAALNDGLFFAVRVDAQLKPLRDYHTAQVPPSRRNARWSTRAEELANRGDLNTILSERWYWTGMAATVALWPSEKAAAPSVRAIKEALLQPKFTLYLGRKSCPPDRPILPEILAAEDLEQAFRLYDGLEKAAHAAATKGKLAWDAVSRAFAFAPGADIWADVDAVPLADRPEAQSRRDAIRDRRAWTFSDRAEARIKACEEAGGTDVSHQG